MKPIALALALLFALGVPAVSQAQVTPAPQLINFQGRLANPNGAPVPDTNTLSITFSLWDAKDVGTGAKRWEQTVAPITVKSGLFSVLLDFATGFTAGANINTAFNGSAWLQIQVGTDSPLTPRQRLVSVAYALKANSVADGSVTNASLAGGITADKFAANLFNTTAWLLGGNSGVTASNFLGTTDIQPLVFRVNNRQAMRYSYAENANFAYRSINVLGGSEINSIAAGVVGATIAGGGWDYFTLADLPNRVTGDFGTVGGGFGNTASSYATVGGGSNNAASGEATTVAGGRDNTASANNATIGGGEKNIASGTYATVGGGYQSVASANTATVGGGASNFATGNAASVAGGAFNIASGQYATVPGGSHNTAVGNYSFAAGQQAHADFIGSFVWNDASNTAYPNPFASTGPNQFLIRASGGVGINTPSPTAGTALDVNGTARMTGFLLPTGAGAGKVLLSDASGAGTWGQVTGLSLPFSQTVNTATDAFSLTNSGGNALVGNSGFGNGLFGTSSNGNGVEGDSSNGFGVYGLSTRATNGFGIYGSATGTASYGVYGFSNAVTSYGVYGDSSLGTGVYGNSNNNGVGVYGKSVNNVGVYGQTANISVSGVYGRNDGAGWGVFGYSAGGFAGVFGSSANNGVYGQTSSVGSGVYGKNDGAGVGVSGYSVGGVGVDGRTSAAGSYGGYFTNYGGGVAIKVAGTAQVSVLEITGGADLAEKFEVQGQIEPGMVVEIDPEHEGKLRLSQSAFNRRVAGVISGAKRLSAGVVLTDPNDNAKDSLPVAMSGRVWVWCHATTQAVEPGDFLTTAERPGYAMPVSDLSKAQGAILGKAMTSLPRGKVGLVLALVNLQ